MQLKPWMINSAMWASGVKLNKWKVYTGWLQLQWFAERKPEWHKQQVDFLDFSFSIIMQKDTGWN